LNAVKYIDNITCWAMYYPPKVDMLYISRKGGCSMNILNWIGWILVALASAITLAFSVVRASLNGHRTTPTVGTPMFTLPAEMSATTDCRPSDTQTTPTRGVDIKALTKLFRPEKEQGKPYAQQLHEYVRGELEHHKRGLHMARDLREHGARQAAENELTREHLRHARKAVDLYKITVVSRAGVSRLRDSGAPVDAWYQLRRKALFSRATVSPQNPPLSRLGRLWAKLTRRLYKGACQALYLHHRTELRHAEDLKQTVDICLAECLNDQAFDVLRSEADRHFQLSYRPGEKIETF
jgi:hypothetical protein